MSEQKYQRSNEFSISVSRERLQFTPDDGDDIMSRTNLQMAVFVAMVAFLLAGNATGGFTTPTGSSFVDGGDPIDFQCNFYVVVFDRG